MAPKAKAALRRPAARGALVGRRPAAAAPPPGVPAPKRVLGDLDMPSLSRLQHIWLKKGRYYHREVDLVGKVVGVRIQDGQIFLDLDATGTEDEGLLRSITGKQGRRVAVHVCPPGCNHQLTDEYLIHGHEYEAVDLKAVPWYTNLVQVVPELEEGLDEMAAMRKEAEKRRALEEGRPEGSPRKRRSKEEKKAKREREDAERLERKRSTASQDSEDMIAGKKDLGTLYGGTALDPDPKSRKRILKKARKLGRGNKKKKKKSSSGTSRSSTSSSGASSLALSSGGLFNSERKMKSIWKRYPGALAASAVMDARELLMTTSGTLHDVDHRHLPPITTQFVRQHLGSSMSPPMLQEALTLSTCLDTLLMGKPASTCDIIAQRLKSLENVALGHHWSVGRQLELVRSDPAGLTNESEGLDAARRAREEVKLKAALAKNPNARGADGSSSAKGKKGKDFKGAGKGGSEDGKKGKGGETRKDVKGQWQKQEK